MVGNLSYTRLNDHVQEYDDQEDDYTNKSAINYIGGQDSSVQEEAALLLKKGEGSIYGSIFNMTNGAIGTGILALPFAIAQCGIVLGPLLMLMFAGLMSYTLGVICQTAMLFPLAKSYETLVRYSLGRTASLFLSACIIFQTFGSCTSYMIILGSSFGPILQLIIPQEHTTLYHYIANDKAAALIISVLFIFPLALQKSMHHLRFSSTLSVACVSYIVFVVVLRSVQSFPKIHDHSMVFFSTQGISILTAIPLIVFAFRSHTSMPPIHRELRDNHIMSRVRRVVFGTVGICAVLYYTTGIFGYLTFFDLTKDNILKNYGDHDTIVTVARGLLTFVMICHYPVTAYCCRSAIDFLLFGSTPLTNRRHIIETLLLWACCFGTSVAVPSITVVLGLAGSIPFTEFLLPSIFLRRFHTHKDWKGIKGRQAVFLSYFYSGFALLIAVLCTSSIIYKNFIKHSHSGE